MNPSNPFGSSQRGAFQPTSSSVKSGLFQSFGQPAPQNQANPLGFFPPSAFGQPGSNQSSSPGSTLFGPGLSFGQTPKQTSSLPSQTPAFGQTSVERNPPAYGQTTGTITTSVFGQTAGTIMTSRFGQTTGTTMTSGFGQTTGTITPSGFGQTTGTITPSGFGQTTGTITPSGFGQTTGTTTTSVFGQTTGLIQTSMFGQTAGTITPSGFGQTTGTTTTSVFGQTSGPTQTSVFGQTSGPTQTSVFGQTSGPTQTSVFGQTSGPTQTSVFGQTSGPTQTSVFGQTSGPTQTSVFGQTSGPTQTSVFGQTSGTTQTSVFGQTSGPTQGGQTPGFGQSAFGQPTAFGQAPGFGQQSSGFGSSQVSSGSSSGQPQSLGFGQSVFGQTTSTGVSTSGFGAGMTQSISSRAEFSFKPATEALFKPIFSASPEPTIPQTTSLSSSPFSSSLSRTTSSTTSFPLLSAAQSGPLGFSFSQPAVAPSASVQNNLTPADGSSATPSTLQFTFSQPAVPAVSNTKTSSTQPTTPSSFSFSTKALLPQAPPLFGSKPAAEAETGADGTRASFEGIEDTNVFARLSKGNKRKEDPSAGGAGPQSTDEQSAHTDSPRQPPKRPLMRSRGPPGGLFGRALTGLRKDVANPVRRDETRQHTSELQEAPEEQLTPTPPAAHMVDVQQEPVEGSDSANAPEAKHEAITPTRRDERSESLEGLSGAAAADCTTIQCRNVPPVLNKKDIIQKHFARFGKVRNVFCRLAKNLAIVHFEDHVSAAKAKKRGKVLHGHELLLLWQRKKQSPGDKGGRAAAVQEDEEAAGGDSKELVSSPLRRPPPKVPAATSSMTLSRSSPVKKPPPAKSLQFASDPQRESVSEVQNSERPVPSSLLHLIGQVAETAEDKYRLLEQRDKVLRQGRPKRTDLDLSKVFVGTCADMCPEKERYMRETRNQLSIFELIPDTQMVDHAAAIKEYSRSSADQEEPLPHELRPLPVLSMTMDYLVTQIMDQGHDNYRDWYDFVWNRTRGIRKDITQQHLCCPHTVSLIEKCTRFHIHCAHHLCEEHMSAFDAKINNENMTKCLQSLKEMYGDLRTRHIYCPQEAELRQYSVLLKLNDGDILREVQQFRDEVRNSVEVKFAVQAFAALNSNNFVRFFKLVKGASYLSGCLLHRYFNQVRAKALRTLSMAHTVGPRSTAFPIEDIVRMLMFHSAAEAADFIQQYGLNVSDGMVELSRIAYQERELPVSQKKSEFILAKKTVMIGEVVNGGPLPNPPQHSPVCSFDSQSRYLGEGPPAEPAGSRQRAGTGQVEVTGPPSSEVPTQMALVTAPPPEETEEPREPQQLFQPLSQPHVAAPAPPQLVYSDEDLAAELDSLLSELVDTVVKEVSADAVGYVTTALTESTVQVEALLTEVLGQMLQEVCSDEVLLERERVAEEKRKLEEARRRQEHEALLLGLSASLCSEVLQEVLDDSIQEIAASEIQQAANERAQCVARCTEQVCSSLLEETLSVDIALLAEETLETELQVIHKYIKRWRDVVLLRRQLKRQMRGFPAAPCCVDPHFKLKALAPSAPPQPSRADLARGLVNLGNAGMLAVSSSRLWAMRQEAVHQMKVQYFFKLLLDEMMWAPLDLPALVTENLPDPPERIFWKAVLLLPSEHESIASVADSILSDWLEVKLGGEAAGSKFSEEKLDGALRTLLVSNSLQRSSERTHRVHVSVKVSRGPLTESSFSRAEERSELRGTRALILLLPALSLMESSSAETDVVLLSALLQLRQIQQASSWHQPLPLVVLVPGPKRDTLQLEGDLMLRTLVKDGLISEYVFVFIPESTGDLQGSRQLNLALRWLLSRAPPAFPLSCQTLVQLVESSLCAEFGPRVFHLSTERACACLPPQDPAPAIQLYNAVLAHIADKVSSEDLSRLSWPPAEFSMPDTREFVPHLSWNAPSHLAWLRECVLSLQLPQWQQLPTAGSRTELRAAIFHYASQIPVSRRSQPLLMSRLENLLEQVRPQADAAAQECHIPWEDVLVICIDHKLKDWQLPGPPVCEDALTEDGEILVYAPVGALKGFQPPEEWNAAVRETHRQRQQENQGAGAAEAPPPCLTLRHKLFHSLMEESAAPPTPPLDVSPTAHRVLLSLEKEKAESRRSTRLLQQWMDSDPLDQWSSSLLVPSSTLLSMSTIMTAPPAPALTEDGRAEGPLDGANRRPVSVQRRLQELEQQLLANQEEELSCRMQLSAMLSIVED